MSSTVLFVAQAFKGSFAAETVGRAFGAAARSAGVTSDVILASDGGDGLLEALSERLTGTTTHRVSGMTGSPVSVPVGWLDRVTALVESRMVCGLSLVSEKERAPLDLSTGGLGELLMNLVSEGAAHVVVGLGGSATVDGGIGMAGAWGWVPRGEDGEELPAVGRSLARIRSFERGDRPDARLTALCDVRNPLLGPSGALQYALQKGAEEAELPEILAGFDNLVRVCARECGDDSFTGDEVGAGAAGGLGFGLQCFGRAELLGGARWVLEKLNFESRLRRAEIVVVGEGGFDRTSLSGKLTGEVIQSALTAGRKVLLVAPRAEAVPEGVVTVTGRPAHWSLEDLKRNTRAGLGKMLSLPPTQT